MGRLQKSGLFIGLAGLIIQGYVHFGNGPLSDSFPKPAFSNPPLDSMGPWPRPIPCRIREGQNRDLFIMVLGDVQTPLADGVYDPIRDEVVLKDGSIIRHYYRDKLNVRYYQPIDKAHFPVPPSGWIS